MLGGLDNLITLDESDAGGEILVATLIVAH